MCCACLAQAAQTCFIGKSLQRYSFTSGMQRHQSQERSKVLSTLLTTTGVEHPKQAFLPPVRLPAMRNESSHFLPVSASRLPSLSPRPSSPPPLPSLCPQRSSSPSPSCSSQDSNYAPRLAYKMTPEDGDIREWLAATRLDPVMQEMAILSGDAQPRTVTCPSMPASEHKRRRDFRHSHFKK